MQLEKKIFSFLFATPSHRLHIIFQNLILAGLYLVGAAHWAFFLNFGKVPYDLHDWQQAGAYYSFLQEAVQTNQFPLHIESDLVNTDRYLARPDTPLSPNILLLRFLDPGVYTLVDTVFWYSAGFAGLLLLKKRFNLSLVAFSAVFLVFNFNGHIVDHLAVGHTMWVGYFLLPFLALQLVALVNQSQRSWTWAAVTALIFTGMFLLGSYHLALWCGMFTALLGLFQPKYLPALFKALLLATLLSLWRILAPVVEFSGGGRLDFLTGYPSVTHLLENLVILRFPAAAIQDAWMAIGIWEMDVFIGLVGAALIGVFGIYLPLRMRSRETILFAPIFGLTVLSIGKIYMPIFLLPLPLVDSERVPARFFIVPLVFLIVLAGIHFQRWIDAHEPFTWRKTAFGLGVMLLLAHDLLQHSRLWRVTNLEALFPKESVNIQAKLINHPDPPYTTALITGAVVSSIAMVLTLFLIRQEHRQIVQKAKNA